jgi:hypothetical protein
MRVLQILVHNGGLFVAAEDGVYTISGDGVLRCLPVGNPWDEPESVGEILARKDREFREQMGEYPRTMSDPFGQGPSRGGE